MGSTLALVGVNSDISYRKTGSSSKVEYFHELKAVAANKYTSKSSTAKYKQHSIQTKPVSCFYYYISYVQTSVG
jgi:hypothetical protein